MKIPPDILKDMNMYDSVDLEVLMEEIKTELNKRSWKKFSGVK